MTTEYTAEVAVPLKTDITSLYKRRVSGEGKSLTKPVAGSRKTSIYTITPIYGGQDEKGGTQMLKAEMDVLVIAHNLVVAFDYLTDKEKKDILYRLRGVEHDAVLWVKWAREGKDESP